jgi:16S rRNA (cytosine967-C5)-methyltransferase
LAAILFVNAAPVAEGERWLDLCAGPGGKAALLAAVAAQTGADLTANEVLEHRATLVRQAIKPVNQSVRVTNNDGREFGKNHPATYDRILVDAPCTGLGSLRRRPESRWTKSAGDLAELNKLQWQLLESAWQALKPGGVIGYVTCSPHQAETNGIVVQAQKTWGDDLEVLDANELLAELNPSLELNRSRRTVQLWPQVHGTDAMFIALLRKRAVGELESKRG